MKNIVFLLFIIQFCSSCITIEKGNPYSNMETLMFNGNFAYEFKSLNASSDRLIIDFTGSGWSSALGVYDNNEWVFTGTAAQLLQILRKDHTILIPEKCNRKPGINYFNDLEARYQYTKENLINCYVSTIDSYLSERNFSTIILIGTSEGAALLPLIYEKMENKKLVKGMVSIAAGGLSMYESYLINIEKNDIPDFWKETYSYSISVHENLEDYSESIETTPLGLVYRQMASFIDIRPFDHYKNINIPILFIHGNKDMNIAVESTMYIQKNLPNKPFEFIYYDMGHIPMEEAEKTRFRKDIAKWIRKIS
jgi:pimeloyl-ACP methyl ester carboxylesterase